jgi:hypothetical protein
MSRTYRRRRYRQLFNSDHPLTDWWVQEDEVVWEDVNSVKETFEFIWYARPRYNIEYKSDSNTGRKLIAIARSDAATHNCKEPGPGWFRNLYVARPLRRKAKNEIHKFMLDPDYEPMILTDPPLPYWT